LPEIVQLLIHQGAEIGEREEESIYPAMQYIGDNLDPFRIWLMHGKSYKDAVTETIQVLLHHGANIDEKSFDGLTALLRSLASETSRTYVLESILSFGPTVTTGGDPLRSPLYFLSDTLRHDRVNKAKIKILIEYSHMHLEIEEFQETCKESLRNCVKGGTLGAAEAIIEALSPHQGAIIDDMGLLFIAATYDEPEMIKLLLDAGSSIDLDDCGTAAACAASVGRKRALEVLLSRGSTLLNMPDSQYEETILHDVVSPLNSPAQSFALLDFIDKNFRDLFIPIVNNYNSFGFTALHETIIWGNLKSAAKLLHSFEASPLDVMETSISPTTLILVLQSYPPWYFKHQGASAIEEYKCTLKEMLEYFCDTCELDLPNIDYDCQQMNMYWTQPDHKLWAKGDSASDWFRVVV